MTTLCCPLACRTQLDLGALSCGHYPLIFTPLLSFHILLDPIFNCSAQEDRYELNVRLLNTIVGSAVKPLERSEWVEIGFKHAEC